jgi:hypothetical protein
MSSPEFAVHQEEDAVATRPALLAAATAIVVGGAAVAVAWFLLLATSGAPAKAASLPAPETIANIEQSPIWGTRRGLDLHDRQVSALHTWGWVDRDAGLALIPIDRAIDIVVERQR